MRALRFGTFLAPNILPVYQAVTAEVGRRLGRPTNLVVETSYDNCAGDINDVCFVCSLPYIEFEEQGIAPVGPDCCARAERRAVRRPADPLLGRDCPSG